MLSDSIDTTAKPCQNFYQFACGKYIKTKINEGISSSSTFGELASSVNAEVLLKLKNLNPNAPNLLESMKTTAEIFRACKDGSYDKEAIRIELLRQLTEMGGWPIIEPGWHDLPQGETVFTIMAKLSRNYGVATYLDPIVNVDWKHIDHNALFFNNPKPFAFNIPFNATSMWFDIVKILKPDAPDDARIWADLVAMFDMSIDIGMRIIHAQVPVRSYDDLYHPFTLQSLKKRWPHIDWKDYTGTLVGTNSEQEINDFHYIVAQPSMIDVVDDFMDDCNDNSTCKRTLVNFLLVRSLETSIGYLYSNPRPNSDGKCLRTLLQLMPYTVGRLYTGDNYPKEKRAMEKYLVNSTFMAFKQELKDLTWMDKKTKDNAYLKVDHAVQNIAYPDWMMVDEDLNAAYHNLSIHITDRSNWFDVGRAAIAFIEQTAFYSLRRPPNRHDFLSSPATVNAWYVAEFNSITLPAGIMNPGFFNTTFPQATNFGALGTVIGHELTHGFDNNGILFFWNGTLYTWMTDHSQQGFEKMAKCVIDQYNKFCYKNLGSNVCVNGRQTVGENIADNGGIKAAFRAYQSYVQTHGPEQRLKGLEKYSMEQIFFLSFAHVWCRVTPDEALKQQLRGDVHSPGDARVIETLRNFPEFGKAFNCQVGDPMMPKDHCDVW